MGVDEFEFIISSASERLSQRGDASDMCRKAYTLGA
jgi:hypothetical protein